MKTPQYRCRKILLVLLSFLLALLCGCSTAPSAMAALSAQDVIHSQLFYNLDISLFPELNEEGVLFRNITETGACPNLTGGVAAGWMVLSNSYDLSAVQAAVDQWDTALIAAYARHNGIAETDARSKFYYTLFSDDINDAVLVYDKEFFITQNLLMIDICCEGAIWIDLKVSDPQVVEDRYDVDLYYGKGISSTADNAGVICLIPIPKECNFATVNINMIEAWSEAYNPLG